MDEPGHLPRLLVSDRQDLPVPLAALLHAARMTLVEESATRSEVSLSFVTTEEIAELHERYLHESGPTDVLSFQIDELDGSGVRILGDVVVCPAVAKERAAGYDDEIRLLVVHGVLHLLGYDHEDEAERRAMWDRQERYSGVRVT